MNLRKFAVIAAFSGAAFSMSHIAYAGLFDDLQKMQKDLQNLQSGNIPKAPSTGGNANSSSGMVGMSSGASGGNMSSYSHRMHHCSYPPFQKNYLHYRQLMVLLVCCHFEGSEGPFAFSANRQITLHKQYDSSKKLLLKMLQ